MGVIGAKTRVIAEETPVIAPETQQSKVKKNKENKK